jgi:hypothetical protein
MQLGIELLRRRRAGIVCRPRCACYGYCLSVAQGK